MQAAAHSSLTPVGLVLVGCALLHSGFGDAVNPSAAQTLCFTPASPLPSDPPALSALTVSSECQAMSMAAIAGRLAAGDLYLLGYRMPINRATIDDLEQIPGVGPVLAARLLASRRQQGAYRTPADLQRVTGIGPRRAQQLATQVVFSDRLIWKIPQ